MSERDPDSRYPELLADLADQIATKLVEHGFDMEKAADVGFSIVEYVRTHWGGQGVYIPKGDSYVIDQVHLEIFEQFNGSNHNQLAARYNLSRQRIYQIVKIVRTNLMKKRQGQLFPEETAT